MTLTESKDIQDLNAREFIIRPFTFDREKGRAELHYTFDDVISFSETIDFGMSCSDLSEERYEALLHCLSFLQIAAGVSYYKALIPPVVRIDNLPFDDDLAEFFAAFYIDGLGEFAYRNELDLRDHIKFEYDASEVLPKHVKLQNHAAVLFGVGKDSIVSAEILKAHKKDFSLFAVNPAQEILDGIKVSDQEAIIIKRYIDQGLFKLNEQGAYNGHVPITGMLSFIAICASLIYDYDAVVLSNERSANEGNVEIDGLSVNHQYSKSIDFEERLQLLLQNKMLHNVQYFSLLRPMSELHIAQQFSKIDAYDSAFTSCNANFRIHARMQDKKWCNNCPKCRFAFLILAASLPKDRMLRIFGHNLLNDADQKDGYEELLGLKNHKPWECVGEIMESRLALMMLTESEEWKDDLLVGGLAAELKPYQNDIIDARESYFKLSSDHLIPSQYLEALNAFLD